MVSGVEQKERGSVTKQDWGKLYQTMFNVVFCEGLFGAFKMLRNTGSSAGRCAEEPTLGKAAPGREIQSTQATGPLGNYFFKDRGNGFRLERENTWILSSKRKSTKLELINA